MGLLDFLKYDKYGFDINGYDRDGYDMDGFNRRGFDREGYNKAGYDSRGYNRDGFDREGFDKDGYDREGFDEDGYNKAGHDRDGRPDEEDEACGVTRWSEDEAEIVNDQAEIVLNTRHLAKSKDFTRPNRHERLGLEFTERISTN